MALYQGDNLKQTKTAHKTNRFLTPGKNFEIIAKRIHKNDTLCKLLTRYNDTPLDDKDPTLNERAEVLNNRVRPIPILEKEDEVGAYILLSTGSIVTMSEGLSFNISFDILCNTDIWKLQGYHTRPMLIMNEIDAIFSDTKVSGIGKMNFLGATPLKINEKMLGYTMLFNIGEI